VVITAPPREALDLLAAFMEGGIPKLKAAIRRKGSTMNDKQYDNTDRLYMEPVAEGLWRGFNNESFLGGKCHRAYLEKRKSEGKVWGDLIMDLGDRGPLIVPVFLNEKPDGTREPGSSTDTHWVNFYKNSNGSISIAFKAKEPRQTPAPAAAPAAAGGDNW
jgi:hypothetical protein